LARICNDSLAIDEAQASPHGQKIDIALADRLQAGVGLGSHLQRQLGGNVRPGDVEPGGVEDLQVVGVDTGVEAPPQRIAGEEYGHRAAAGHVVDGIDDRCERQLMAEVSVDGVQAGRPAALHVRLRFDVNAESGAGCAGAAHGRLAAAAGPCRCGRWESPMPRGPRGVEWLAIMRPGERQVNAAGRPGAGRGGR